MANGSNPSGIIKKMIDEEELAEQELSPTENDEVMEEDHIW